MKPVERGASGAESQWSLIRRRFSRHRLAVASLLVLGALYTAALLAEFVAPYSPSRQDLEHIYAPPQLPRFSWRDGLHVRALERHVDPVSFQRTYRENPDRVVPLRLFARGEAYQYNPTTHDARTNGTLASLLGLQAAHETREEYRRMESIRRINLAHALILSVRGMPLIYSGDEIATLNDQSYKKDPAKSPEGRWVHRPFFDWNRAKKAHRCGSDEHAVFQTLKQLITLRKTLPELDGQVEQVAIDLNTPNVLCVIRKTDTSALVTFFNFSEHHQEVELGMLRQHLRATHYTDLLQGRTLNLEHHTLHLSPYEFLWCKKD